MSEPAQAPSWRFRKFGLIVTGTGERDFLPRLFHALTAFGCGFRVIAKVGQRSPITSSKRTRKMVGTGKTIPDKDATEIGIPARKWLEASDTHLLLIDDLEHDRRGRERAVFDRYRGALDTMLVTQAQRRRASVHFLVNMLEAYYFADAAAINAVLGTTLSDWVGDVEDIRHPKNDLKALPGAFDEVKHGKAILGILNVEHVLDDRATCGSLRVLFAWCIGAMGPRCGDRFRLESGVHDVVTGPQLAQVRAD
jgi:hypothetical protein